MADDYQWIDRVVEVSSQHSNAKFLAENMIGPNYNNAGWSPYTMNDVSVFTSPLT